MRKKIIALCLIVALAATAVIGGTLAYFTDTKDVTNTFAVGRVSIDLIESAYRRSGGDKSGDTDIPDPTGTASEMKYVTDGSKIFTDKEIKDNAEGYSNYLAGRGSNMVPGRKVAKCPYVINTGSSPAYIRIRVLVPSDANYNHHELEGGASIVLHWCEEATASNGEFSGSTTDFTSYTDSSGVKYDQYTFVRNAPLAPGAMTEWNVLDSIGIYEYANQYHIDNLKTKGVIADDGSFKVLVQADAIQAEGFESAAEAWAAFAS